jgi:hypothetical protein
MKGERALDLMCKRTFLPKTQDFEARTEWSVAVAAVALSFS